MEDQEKKSSSEMRSDAELRYDGPIPQEVLNEIQRRRLEEHYEKEQGK